MTHNARHGVRLEYLAWLPAFARWRFRALIRECERRLAHKRKHDLRLTPFVDILEVIPTLGDLSRRQRVYLEIDVVNRGLALLLLM